MTKMIFCEEDKEIRKSDLSGASQSLEDCMMDMSVDSSSNEPKPVMSQRLSWAIKPRDRPMDKRIAQPRVPDSIFPMDEPLNVLGYVFAEQIILDEQLSNTTNIIAEVDNKRAEGKVHLSWASFKEERDCLLRKQLVLLANTSVLRENSDWIADAWATNAREGRQDPRFRHGDPSDRISFADAVWALFPELLTSIKHAPTHSRLDLFRDELLIKYGSARKGNADMAWCPILGSYCPISTMAVTHIVNPEITEPVLQAVLGSDETHTWNTKNALFICKGFRNLLNEGKAAIVPHAGKSGEPEYYFMLLTQDIGRPQASIWHEALQCRRLVFLNDHLPAFKYLYFKFAMAVLRRYRVSPDRAAAVEDLQQHLHLAQTLWAMPGPRYKQSILYKFSQLFGLLTREKADEFWGTGPTRNPLRRLSTPKEDETTTMANILSYGAASMAVEEATYNEPVGAGTTRSASDREAETGGRAHKKSRSV